MKRTFIRKFMEKEVEYWRKRFHIKPIDVSQDNTMWAWGSVGRYAWDNSRFYLQYNAKNMSKDKNLTKNDLMRLIFHELGHLKNKAFSSEMGSINAEYIAEIQCLKWMKKYLSKHFYNLHISRQQKNLKNLQWYKNKTRYRRAWKKIKEYNCES